MEQKEESKTRRIKEADTLAKTLERAKRFYNGSDNRQHLTRQMCLTRELQSQIQKERLPEWAETGKDAQRVFGVWRDLSCFRTRSVSHHAAAP